MTRSRLRSASSSLALVLVVAGCATLGVEACGGSDGDGADPGPSANGEGGGGGGDGGPGSDSPSGGQDGDPTGNDGGKGDATDGSQPDPDAETDGNFPASKASCVGVAATCGGNKDCCASNAVPGGSFNRSNDGTYPATVSSFTLDVYEVTVGRFRTFVNAGKGTQASPPAAGDGAHPKIASSGWAASFNASLPADTAALKAALKCNAAYPAWTDTPNGNENKPINCVSWFEAFAFCAWDGGRLPTEAEWNYAAAGGNEQRTYPWGAAIDHAKASYACSGRGGPPDQDPCTPNFSDMRTVGSFSPQGDGKWGHADLAGNVWEYTLDYSKEPYRLTTCTDCADLQPTPDRTFRGGGFANQSYIETTSTRIYRSPQIADYDVGIRCAR